MLLIADEPTTALDVTVQFQILGLLRELCDKLDMAMLFITHDLGVVAQLVDRVAVMYAGRIVETSTVETLFSAPAHPYTRGLMSCMPAPRRRDPPHADHSRPGAAARRDRRRLCLRAALSGRARHLPRRPASARQRGGGSRGAVQVSGHRREAAMSAAPILDVRDLRTGFDVKRSGRKMRVKAVDGVSLTLAEREVLGIVGESGCGKTTVGRSIIRLTRADSGTVVFNGIDVLSARGQALRTIRLHIRMVFQDPYASLNPRRSVGDSVAEAGDINGVFTSRAERAERVAETLTAVGLDPSFAGRFPHELSGGQRQRVGIARAILPTPEIIIADEPVSALDVSIQAQVLNLLMDLREQLGLSMLFISHDLGVIGQISDRVAVMYMGRVVELADAGAILQRPTHPYARALMAAMPKPDPSQRIAGGIELGEPPSQFARSAGCAYALRCPLASDRCTTEAPALRDLGDGRSVACHNV